MGMQLIAKGKKGLLHTLFSRVGIIVVLLLLNMGLVFSVFKWFMKFVPLIAGGTVICMVIMVLLLLNNSQMDATSKNTWLVLMLVLPVFGGLLYCYIQMDFGHRLLKRRLARLVDETRNSIPQDEGVLMHLAEESPETVELVRYLNQSNCHPVFNKTDVTYFALGEAKYEALLEELEKAEHFIFMEYFIVEEGLMWGKVLEVLARKAAEGVEVRVMYDGMCEFMLLTHDYPKRLKELGIQCKMFAPVTPLVSTHYNNRDHRKILIIDGHTGFNGGVNFADEYINYKKKFGHWKDTAVMLKGEAVKSFTLMFLQMWNADERQPDFEKYLRFSAKPVEHAGGFVIPYGDCPLDNERVGESVYMDILNRAHSYVHIMTPYLILDGELECAIRFAARRGVDVSIILPGIPDKRTAYSLAKSHYASLVEAGVKIYEYMPGFVHAKVFVSDDIKAVVGTINLDYRSLYHHFECATYMYHTDCIRDIEKDFQDTLNKCRLVTKETIKKEKTYLKVMGWLLKAVAPLM